MVNDFYSIKEFAKLLKVHHNTVRNGIKYGRIQAFRVGKGKTSSYRIPYTEVQRMALFDMNQVIKNIAKVMKDE